VIPLGSDVEIEECIMNDDTPLQRIRRSRPARQRRRIGSTSFRVSTRESKFGEIVALARGERQEPLSRRSVPSSDLNVASIRVASIPATSSLPEFLRRRKSPKKTGNF
jgi:hypothetical protein